MGIASIAKVRRTIELPQDIAERLREIAEESNCSIHAVILDALSQYTGIENIRFRG